MWQTTSNRLKPIGSKTLLCGLYGVPPSSSGLHRGVCSAHFNPAETRGEVIGQDVNPVVNCGHCVGCANNPYTEPMDWVAVSQGGEPIFTPMYTAAHEPNTGAIILQAL